MPRHHGAGQMVRPLTRMAARAGTGLAALLLCTLQAAAATYYVANDGDDASAGTSASAPWATLAKVNSTTFQPGDQILFRRGDGWHDKLVASSDGSAAEAIVYADYGDVSLPKPTFWGSDVVPNASFEPVGNSVYTFSSAVLPGGIAYWIYADKTPLLAATSGGPDMPARSFYIDGTTVYVNTDGQDPSTGSVVYTATDRAVGSNADSSLINSNGHSNLVFKNLIGRETAQVAQGGALKGGLPGAYVFRIMGGGRVKLDHCEAYYGGNHHFGAINTTDFVATGLVAQGIVGGVEGNGLPYGNATALVSYSDNGRRGDTYQWIDCTVSNYSGSQPAFLTHNDGESIASVLVQNLTSLGSPMATMPGDGETMTVKGGLIQDANLDVYGNATSTTIVDGLTLTGESAKITVYSSNTRVQNCVIRGSVQDGGIIANGPNTVVRFNTIAMRSDAGSAIHIGSGAAGTELLGNLITGTRNAIRADGTVAYQSDYNFVDTEAGAPQYFINGQALTLEQMRAAGKETHAAAGKPEFTNAADGDFTLSAGSPAADFIPAAGLSGIPSDIAGRPRPSGKSLDAGAHEYQSPR